MLLLTILFTILQSVILSNDVDYCTLHSFHIIMYEYAYMKFSYLFYGLCTFLLQSITDCDLAIPIGIPGIGDIGPGRLSTQVANSPPSQIQPLHMETPLNSFSSTVLSSSELSVPGRWSCGDVCWTVHRRS